ncbi:MAG TPA: GHKL domain-containing protein [Thermoanaerobacterales bacterium]|jgi:signal transduction histidine kinase|nr:GHKL domain-containing protein [Thermoanaerobacterales bacterium]
MGDGRWPTSAKNIVRSIKHYYDYLIKNTYTIERDSPLYVKEGSHRILIDYQDKEKDNHIHAFDVNFSVIEDSKGLLGCLVTYEDVIELEEMRNKKAQYESLLAEKELAASYVHEIKNPIFSIRGFLQILQQSFNEDDKRKEYTDIIINELDRMNNLLNEFLSKYREHTSTKVQNDKGVSIKLAIEEIIAFFQYSLELKGINYKLDLDDELFVSIDRDQLMQIFINLIQNSIEAMKEGGHLTIKAYGKDDRIYIEIKDEGVGIKQDQVDKIFKPFFSTKEKGTGLGLYITKRIVDNYGGSMSLKSTEGKGTTCYLEFPMKS